MASRKISPLMILPPLIFGVLAVVFYFGMQRGDPNELPSTMIGRAAPDLPVDGVAGYAIAQNDMLRTGQVTLVNFWATWCPPCRAEHPKLLELADQGVRIIGVNFKDEDSKAVAYLGDEGNPFLAVGYDPNGRAAINWGVTGPPETFIVAGDGTVLYRFVGPLVGADFENRFLPELDKALN